MAYTTDRRPGTSYRDTEFQVASTGASTVVAAQGGIRYNGSAFQLLDAVGQYDPRTAGLLAHAVVYDMPHILAGSGPVLQGAYKTQTFVGGSFLSAETWWTSSAQTIKLSSHSFTYGSTYVNPLTESWVLYSGTTANTVVHKVTDTMTYAGVLEVSRTRVYS